MQYSKQSNSESQTGSSISYDIDDMGIYFDVQTDIERYIDYADVFIESRKNNYLAQSFGTGNFTLAGCVSVDS